MSTAEDGIELLRTQHERIRQLLDLVQANSGPARAEHFDELRVLLAVHEVAEELAVRPLTRRLLDAGGEVAAARMAEENSAKQILAALEQAGPDSEEFEARFGELKLSVSGHAAEEEHVEFPALRRTLDSDALAQLAAAVRAAEATAPTHPHPLARTTTAVAALGPVASIIDRARDAVRALLG